MPHFPRYSTWHETHSRISTKGNSKPTKAHKYARGQTSATDHPQRAHRCHDSRTGGGKNEQPVSPIEQQLRKKSTGEHKNGGEREKDSLAVETPEIQSPSIPEAQHPETPPHEAGSEEPPSDSHAEPTNCATPAHEELQEANRSQELEQLCERWENNSDSDVWPDDEIFIPHLIGRHVKGCGRAQGLARER